jgi:hypothetical protein
METRYNIEAVPSDKDFPKFIYKNVVMYKKDGYLILYKYGNETILPFNNFYEIKIEKSFE